MQIVRNVKRGVLAGVFSLVAGGLFATQEIYVAVDDPQAGDTPVEGRGGESLPYKTLQAAMQHTGLASGDTVWVKPGTYDASNAVGQVETPVNVTNLYRVIVPAGVTVRATGGAENTFLVGAKGPGDNGTGAGAIRGAYLYDNAVLRGFTITNCYAAINSDTYGYGGGVKLGSGAALIDCTLTMCHGRRGGATANGTLIRCRYKNNGGYYTGRDSINGNFFNCLFEIGNIDTYHVYQPAKLVNCTFIGGGSLHAIAINNLQGDVYNTLIVGGGLSTPNTKTLYNTVFAHAGLTASLASSFDAASFVTNKVATCPVNGRFAPLKANPATDRCTDYAAYEALFAAAYKAEAAYDFYGNPRRGDGVSFEAGAVERNDAIDIEDWYVDATAGDDGYTGPGKGGADHPFKTLQAAMDNPELYSGQTVHVKPGTYDQGGRVSSSYGSTTTNRVVLAAGVKLVSTDGKDVTIIKGGPCTRCILAATGAEVRGFTIRDGVTDTASAHGGGVYGVSGATFVDCIIRECKANRGGAVYGNGDFIRCQFIDCRCTVLAWAAAGGSASQRFYNCLFASPVAANYAVYITGNLVNCSFVGPNGTADHNSDRRAINTLFLCGFSTINGTYENCAFGYDGAKPSASLCDDNCLFASSKTAFPLYTDYAPAKSNPCRGRCSGWDEYVALFPAGYQDEANYDVYGRPRRRPGETTWDLGCVQWFAEYNREDWYVDKVKGDDTYTGEDIGFAEHPYKTLKAAVENNTRLREGHVIHVLPGVYDTGTCGTGNTLNRVIVPAGVTLESTGGAAVTEIRGAKAPEEGLTPGIYGDTYGLGVGSVRSVKLGARAVLRGFTVANGTAWATDASHYHSAGNISADSTAWIVDCVITNGAAARGGGAEGGNYVRCHFDRNRAASLAATLYNRLALYGCLVERSNTLVWYVTGVSGDPQKVVNTTFAANNDGVSVRDDPGVVHFINSVDMRGPVLNNPTDHGPTYINSFVIDKNKYVKYADSRTIVTNTTVAAQLDANLVPLRDSLLIDAGSNLDYQTNWPSAYLSEFDLCGTPRVLNRTIDIGAREYDWCVPFGAALSKSSRFAVTNASANVVLGDPAGVVLEDGGKLAARWTNQTPGREVWYVFTATVAGAGTCTYRIAGGEAVELSAGTHEIRFKSTAASVAVDFAFSGAGTATLTSFSRAGGLVLLVR